VVGRCGDGCRMTWVSGHRFERYRAGPPRDKLNVGGDR
jgi:hypothetical protein